MAIGIDHYQYWHRLANAVNDAMGLGRVLEERFGFTVRTLVTPEQTRGPRIGESIVDELKADVEEDDLVVIFFAGHGHTVTLPDGRQHGYIVPVDARTESISDLISMDELSGWTEHLQARHVFCILDSCFSGIATHRGARGKGDANLHALRARRVITAGSADQQVSDGGWGGHSVFTGALICGLNGEAANDQGVVTAGGLFQFVSSRVAQSTDQTPAEGVLRGHEGGDITFAPESPFPGKPPAPTILPVPPPSLGFLAEYFARPGTTVRSNMVDLGDHAPQPAAFPAKESIFAKNGRQWAIILGTNPHGLHLDHSETVTETLDARDVLDWFIDPDVYGELVPDQLAFAAGQSATDTWIQSALERVAMKITEADSLLFYFSGHVIDSGGQTGLLLSDYEFGSTGPNVRGLLDADELVTWFNAIPAHKVIAILDSGGDPFHRASVNLGRGRYVVSSRNGFTLGRNGCLTWYLNRLMRRSGRSVTLGAIFEVLRGADAYAASNTEFPNFMYPYILGGRG